MANIIPLSRNKLKPYVTLYTLKGGAFFSGGASDFAAQLAALQSQFIPVGSIGNLVETQVRERNSVYRELNSDPGSGTFGAPVESYPGLVSYSLALKRVVLHTSNMLEGFGYLGSDLIQQKVPMVVQIVKPVPVNANGSPITVDGVVLKVETRTYFGGWFDKNSMEFDSEPGDLKIVQEATMTCTGLVSSITTVPA